MSFLVGFGKELEWPTNSLVLVLPLLSEWTASQSRAVSPLLTDAESKTRPANLRWDTIILLFIIQVERDLKIMALNGATFQNIVQSDNITL